MFVLVGFGLRNTNHLEGFGESSQVSSTKAQVLHLIRSIRTVVKCKRKMLINDIDLVHFWEALINKLFVFLLQIPS